MFSVDNLKNSIGNPDIADIDNILSTINGNSDFNDTKKDPSRKVPNCKPCGIIRLEKVEEEIRRKKEKIGYNNKNVPECNKDLSYLTPSESSGKSKIPFDDMKKMEEFYENKIREIENKYKNIIIKLLS